MAYVFLVIFLAILIFLSSWAYIREEAWPMLLTPVALTLAAAIAYRHLEHARRARCSGLLMQLHQTWDSEEYIEYIKSRRMINQCCNGSTLEEDCQNLKDTLQSFDEKEAEEFYIIVRIANFFENLGFLGRKNYLDKEDALELFGSTAERYWILFSAWVKYHRLERESPQPNAWIYFEDIASGFPKKI